MSQDQAQAQTEDPSMEDILASIRKIISDEEPKSNNDGNKQEEKDMAKAAKETVVQTPQDQEEDLLELTDIIEDEKETPEMNLAEEAISEPVETEQEEMQEIEFENDEEQLAAPESSDAKIISDEVEEASSNAFSQLTDAVSRINAISLGNGSVTLENIVRDSLKPLLKEWLDAHLSDIVETIVKEEVDKIVKKVNGMKG